MADYFIAPLLVLALLGGWLLVQRLARQFADRHPEFGPAREEGAGCGHSCLCSSGGSCKNKPNHNTLLSQEDSRHGQS